MRKISKKLCLLSVCAILVCAFLTVLGCSGDTPPEPEVVNYTVTFDLCTELQTTKVLPKTVVAGSRIDEPQVFITGENSENWEIDGWYQEKTYENEWDFYFDEVNANLTLYAKWKSDPQYTVQYFVGDTDKPSYSVKVKKGLQATECDDRFNGYEVLGYFTSPDFKTEFDFDMPITESTNIYVKLSDYLYFTPKYLSTFTGHNASSVLTSDESVVEISYSGKDNYIFAKGLNFVLNGHELIEIVYKLEGASRVDLFWYASKNDGTPVDGQTDFNGRTENIGLKEFYTDISIDQEGWTHAIYDLTRPRAYQNGTLSAPLSDIGTLNGFRIDVDGETVDPAKLTIKYVKAQKKPIPTGYTVKFYAGETLKYTANVEPGERADKPNDEQIVSGRKVLGYYTTPSFDGGTEFNFETPINADTKVYAQLSNYLYFNGGMLNDFAGVSGATKTLNKDGTLSVGGGNGAFIHRKNLNIQLNGTEILQIRAKVNLGSGAMGLWLFGEYILNEVPGSNTDYGQSYTKFTSIIQKGEPDSEGWVILTIDPSKLMDATGLIYTKIDGLRIDINGGAAETNELVIDYIKSVERPSVENFTVNFYVDNSLKHTADVKCGEYASRISDEKVAFGRQIIGYYSDSMLTTEFNFMEPITRNADIYVKLSDYLYFNGAMLDTFAILNGATKTLNTDGTMTFAGPNGAILNKSALNLALNGKTTLEIKAKTDMKLGGVWALFYNGDQRLTYSAGDTNSDGWTTFTAELGGIETLTQLRFDIYGSAPDSSIQFDYIKVL